MKIKERDEQKVAFITLEGLFEPTVIFFGLMSLLTTFQAMMNELLRDLINTKKVGSFINDVMVGTESKRGHNELVKEILRRLEENDLYVKPEKCRQKVREVDFLEVIIEPKGIKMEEKKVKAVIDQPVPKLVKEVQKFLGLANYYRGFMKNFARIVRLLYELTKKEQKQKWGIRQEKSFEILKKRFTTKPILVALDLDKRIRMEMDVLDYITGGVLSMECEDGK